MFRFKNISSFKSSLLFCLYFVTFSIRKLNAFCYVIVYVVYFVILSQVVLLFLFRQLSISSLWIVDSVEDCESVSLDRQFLYFFSMSLSFLYVMTGSHGDYKKLSRIFWSEYRSIKIENERFKTLGSWKEKFWTLIEALGFVLLHSLEEPMSLLTRQQSTSSHKVWLQKTLRPKYKFWKF